MPTDHAEVTLHDVRVPDAAIFGAEGEGLAVAQTFVHENRIRQAASGVGAGQFCVDRSVAYLFHVNGRYESSNIAVRQELANLVQAGLTQMEALIAATRDAARLMGQEKLSGTVEAGKRADLLLLSADPSRDIAATRAIAGVMVNGRWLAASAGLMKRKL